MKRRRSVDLPSFGLEASQEVQKPRLSAEPDFVEPNIASLAIFDHESSDVVSTAACDIYPIQELLGIWVNAKKIKYFLVQWKGFDSPESCTWEPLANLQDAVETVKHFEDKHRQELKERKWKTPFFVRKMRQHRDYYPTHPL